MIGHMARLLQRLEQVACRFTIVFDQKDSHDGSISRLGPLLPKETGRRDLTRLPAPDEKDDGARASSSGVSVDRPASGLAERQGYEAGLVARLHAHQHGLHALLLGIRDLTLDVARPRHFAAADGEDRVT